MNYYIHVDLYMAGTSDDGSQFYAEAYHVIRQDTEGNRELHHRVFRGCDPGRHEGIQYFGDIRIEARAQADAFMAECKLGKHDDGFCYTPPAYGSPAHAAVGDSGIGLDRY